MLAALCRIVARTFGWWGLGDGGERVGSRSECWKGEGADEGTGAALAEIEAGTGDENTDKPLSIWLTFVVVYSSTKKVVKGTKTKFSTGTTHPNADVVGG